MTVPDLLYKHYLCHQYGISVTELQTFFLAQHCQQRGMRRNGSFHRLIPPSQFHIPNNLKFQRQPCHIQMTSWPVSANISRTKIQQVPTESITNKGSHTNLATCDLFPVACSRHVLHLCYSSTVGATFEHLKICPNPVQNNSLFFLFYLKKKIRN